jgi:hypothetical protein
VSVIEQLNAADLTPGEMRDALTFLAGAAPQAVAGALGLIRHRRENGAPVTEAEMAAEASAILAALGQAPGRHDRGAR